MRAAPCAAPGLRLGLWLVKPNSNQFDARTRGIIKRLGNPYASLSLVDDPDLMPTPIGIAERRRAQFRAMQNPHAHFDFFGESADPETENHLSGQLELGVDGSVPNREHLRSGSGFIKALGEVLEQYRPYVARNEWSKLLAYRELFIEKAARSKLSSGQITERINLMKFTLMPGEKVEYNRAPASRIIQALDQVLN